MATQTTPETTEGGILEQLWDQLGDRVTAVSEWTSRALLRVFGSSNERYIRKLGYIRSGDPKLPHTIIPRSLLARVNERDMDPVTRRGAYGCDRPDGTARERGLDSLRDHMDPARWGDPDFMPFHRRCQIALNYARIADVDHILLDEARTQLALGGPRR